MKRFGHSVLIVVGLWPASGWITVALPALFAAVFPAVTTSHAQRSGEARKPIPGTTDLLKSCPQGHRIEFVFGATSIYLDPRWLGTSPLFDLNQRSPGRCPLEPVSGLDLYLNVSILEAAEIPVGLGRPFLFFLIEKASDTRMRNNLTAAQEAQRRQAAHPFVVDVTASIFGSKPPSPNSRVYRVLYPDGGIGSEPAVEISCGGVPGQPAVRNCFTSLPYRYAGAIDVRYRFQQDQLPLADAAQASSSDAMSEPEGVLTFDTRIRAWLDGALKKP
jgi:hypothetical protein